MAKKAQEELIENFDGEDVEAVAGEVSEEAPQEEAPRKKQKDPSLAWIDDRVTVRVARTEDNLRGQDIPVNCNGVRFVIQDGATVTIPRQVLENLNHAVEYRWVLDGPVGGANARRQIPIPRFFIAEVNEKNEPKSESDKKRLEFMKELGKLK